MKKQTILVGAHVSISGNLEESFARAEALGATTMQIFTKSNRQWFAKNLNDEEINAFKNAKKTTSINTVVAHTGYLINIASSNSNVEKKSVRSLEKELIRCQELDIPYLVLHPGAHTGNGLEKGLEKIVKNLDFVLKKVSGITKIVLETMAGQGTSIGSKFEEIARILKKCKKPSSLGVCFDTCHSFSAGYDLSSPEGYKATMKKFDKVIGLKHLKVVHINNSKTSMGSKKDRHEELEKGTMPLETFKAIMNDKEINGAPKILETPNPLLYKDEIALLKSYS
jgi:deoxyribonuclease IV